MVQGAAARGELLAVRGVGPTVVSLIPNRCAPEILAKHLDHAKREAVARRFFDIPANAIEQAAAQAQDISR